MPNLNHDVVEELEAQIERLFASKQRLLRENAKLQTVVDAAIAWANTDQNDIDGCDKTNLELLDAVTEYEMSAAALKEANDE